MQQETYKAINELVNAVTSYHKTVEHINSNNSLLSGQISKLEELIRDLLSQM